MKILRKKTIATIFIGTFTLLSISCVAQGWINEYGNPLINEGIIDFMPTDDGGYFFTGTKSTELWIGKISSARNLSWDTSYNFAPQGFSLGGASTTLIKHQDGSFFILCKALGNELALLRFNQNAALLSQNSFYLPDSALYSNIELAMTENDQVLMMMATIGYSQDNDQILLIRADSSGAETGRDTLYEEGKDYFGLRLISLMNGSFLLLNKEENELFLTEINDEGNVINKTPFPDTIDLLHKGNIATLYQTKQQDILVGGVGSENALQYTSLTKFTPDLMLEWSKKYLQNDILQLQFAFDIAETTDTNYVLIGWGGLFPNTHDLYLVKCNDEGIKQWEKIMDLYDSADYPSSVRADENDGVIICGGTSILYPNNDSQGFLLRLDSLGNIFADFLSGKVALDANLNCIVDTSEQGLNGWIVKAEGPSTFYDITDTSGFYEMGLDSGTYKLSITPFGYWETCVDSFIIQVESPFDTTYRDFPVQPSAYCPYLEVNLRTPFIRLCFEGLYYVNYCNSGTVPVDSAYIEVELDSNLNFIGSSIPFSTQNGYVYTFPVGNLDVGECGSFSINFEAPCDTSFLGATLCSEAHIFPDTICMDQPWQGPFIELDGFCDGDSVEFTILNSGGAMQQAFQFIVIEDNIILMQGDFQLDPEEAYNFNIFAENGSTYHLLSSQDLTLPPFLGNLYSSISVVDCNGSSSPGSALQFPANDGQFFLSTECDEVIGSWDPNDKQATPLGWNAEHLIDKQTDLDYRIRFQNTGTDTAFKVVIIDTLSPYLDPTTIRFGAASHSYEAELNGDGVLSFIFDDILLPDSNINEPASHGFINFKIELQKNLPEGTVIYNEANIYFDFNPPVLTNQVFHTIRGPWVSVILSNANAKTPESNLQLFPNPLVHFATVRINDGQHGKGSYQLFNTQGQSVQHGSFEGNQFRLNGENLPSGVYILNISRNGLFIESIKLLVTQ